MIKLLLLLLVFQYVIVYLKYLNDEYNHPDDLTQDLIPGYLWYRLIDNIVNK